MKNHYLYLFIILVLAILSVGALGYVLWDDRVVIEQYNSIDRPAQIRPDYSGTVIPPNIAPLNFSVQEKGSHYCVKISSKQGTTIEIFSRSPKIVIPQKSWHKLLNKNKGEELYLDIFVKRENTQWERFDTITNKIANEDIDGFLVYRRMRPLYSQWGDMGIYQRNLANYDESTILNNRTYEKGCANCHTFLDNNTSRMLIHIRSFNGPSMLLIENGKASNIDSRTQFGSAPIGHTSWHPSGKLITFTIYRVRQFFHSSREEVRDVVDLDSSTGYYLFESETLKTAPEISHADYLETFPTWSPDGRYMYFCRAPILWSDREVVPPENFDKSKYNLVRISYDLESDTWGEMETVLSSEQTGLSIVQPRISPDGKFLLFCMCQYSGFPAFQSNSDLYLMELSTGSYKRLDCNSDESESWHCWSSNGRWIVFSSKKGDGLFIRPYFSYIDENGKASKPFVLPQKNPAFYDSFFKLFQIPELIKSPIPVTRGKLARLIRSGGKGLTDIPITSATPTAKAEPWQEVQE
ncbi:MAG: TolB family protein [Planctomycetota bacterium]|jgi:hypothetical protein